MKVYHVGTKKGATLRNPIKSLLSVFMTKNLSILTLLIFSFNWSMGQPDSSLVGQWQVIQAADTTYVEQNWVFNKNGQYAIWKRGNAVPKKFPKGANIFGHWSVHNDTLSLEKIGETINGRDATFSPAIREAFLFEYSNSKLTLRRIVAGERKVVLELSKSLP